MSRKFPGLLPSSEPIFYQCRACTRFKKTPMPIGSLVCEHCRALMKLEDAVLARRATPKTLAPERDRLVSELASLGANPILIRKNFDILWDG